MFDPSSRPQSIAELTTAITEEAGQIAAAQCRMLLKLAELDSRPDAPFDTACKSAAHWVAARCGVSMGEAWEMVRVGRKLQGLPAVTAAFSKGQVSYCQVRALVRVATRETEETMCEIARYATGPQLDRVVKSYRRVLEAYADPNLHHSRRELSYQFDVDGYLVVRGRLTPEDGRLFINAIEAVAEELRAGSKSVDVQPISAEEPPGKVAIPSRALRADALVAIAESSLAKGLQARAGSDRTQVVLHVDAETLSGTGLGDHCEIEDGPEVATATAQRLACDAAIVTLVESAEGEPLSVGRKTRKIPPAIARALRARDQGCVFPGCGETRFVEAHHIVHWAAGGETSLTNLMTTCWFHHHLLHEGGYRVEKDTKSGDLVFRRPDGTILAKQRQPMGPHDGQLGLEVDVGNTFKRTTTERVDYGEITAAFAREDPRIPKPPLPGSPA